MPQLLRHIPNEDVAVQGGENQPADLLAEPIHFDEIFEENDIATNAPNASNAKNAPNALDRGDIFEPTNFLDFVDENGRVAIGVAAIVRDEVVAPRNEENLLRANDIPAEPMDLNEDEVGAVAIAQDAANENIAEPNMLAVNNGEEVVFFQEEVEYIVIESDDEDFVTGENASDQTPAIVKLERVKVEDQDLAAIQILIHGKNSVANARQHGDTAPPATDMAVNIAAIEAVDNQQELLANASNDDDDVVFMSQPPPGVFAKCERDDISGYVPYTTNVCNLSLNIFLYFFR